MNEEVIKKWVGGICIKDRTVLLIHRINKNSLFNQECFIFPGKTIEGDESIEDALCEEFQKLAITIHLGEQLYTSDEGDEVEDYYLCTYVLGEVSQVHAYGDGKDGADDGSQSYIPVWVSLDDIDDLIIYPESVKDIILETLVDEK